MLFQIGDFKIRGQGHRGVYFEHVGHRVNLKSTAERGCGTGGSCIDSHEDRYQIYVRGRGELSRAQQVANELQAALCPEEGKAYFRRTETDDALLEIFRVRNGRFERNNFRLMFTECRTLAAELTLELEPIPAAELTDVITNDWTVTEP